MAANTHYVSDTDPVHVTQVANEACGMNSPVPSYESVCATSGPCATVRELKALQAART
ncbi:hypothetical protein [Streptomyces achromogenes]|uniref:hypothetical protein n=1 Tax=Streptomyces achromogenes TaxID=67255 RepID=UPI0033C5B0BF